MSEAVQRLRCSSRVIREWVVEDCCSSEYAQRMLRLANAYDQLADALTLPPTRFRKVAA